MVLYHIQAPATLSLRCEGNTALMLAAQGGHTTSAKVLIEAGTDVSIRNVVSNCRSLLTFTLIHIINFRKKRLPLCWLLEVDILRQSRH